jgi:taurine transport system permease protein
MKSALRKTLYILLPFISIALILLGWIALSNTEGSLIPTPAATWDRFMYIMENPIANATLPIHILVSLRRVLIAMSAATVIGITLGVLFGWSPVARAFLMPAFEIVRPIPPIAWLPLIIMWCGIGELPKIIIVFIGAVTGIVINTHAGMKSIDMSLIKAGEALGASRRQLLTHVAIPATFPAILAGIKTSLSAGWMCVLAAEMIAAKQGVGFLIIKGQENGDMALIVVCMFAIGIVSMIISLTLSKLEGVLCPWQLKKLK